MSRLFGSLSLVGVLSILAGCMNDENPSVSVAQPSADAKKYFLTDEPADAKSVIDVKKDAKDGDDVIVVGRIGGSDSPFVSGRASFTVVDTTFIPCNERPGDTCEVPWDYCCDTDRLPSGIAVVKVVDADGKTIALDAKTDLGMKELQTVVVKGKAKRDEAGNLTVLAPALFVRK